MTPSLLLLLELALHPAHAACDVKAFKAKLTASSPQDTPALFTEIAACDPALARELAPSAFQKIFPGAEGEKAALEALEIGAGSTVRTWIASQISDERARTISNLGDQCKGNARIVDFFVESHKALGDQFWRDRWHRGLTDCREPAIRTMLQEAVLAPVPDSSRFGSILEALSRNLGREALPLLKQLALSSKPENQLHVVSAFADAVGVGSMAGMDAEAAREASAILAEIAPQLTLKAVEQVRIVLESLGDSANADRLAAVRYHAVRQADGRFLWGVIVVETATCKGGKTLIKAQAGTIYEPGRRWPDQMQAAVDALVQERWKLDEAKKCKGEGSISVIIPSEPFADLAALQAWRDPQMREIARRSADKNSSKIVEAPLVLP